MDLPDNPCFRVDQKLRLVTDPVDEHPFARDTLTGHAGGMLSESLLYETVVILVELGLLISVRMFLFVLDPAEGNIYPAPFRMDPVIVILEIRHRSVFPLQICRRVDQLLYLTGFHCFQLFK